MAYEYIENFKKLGFGLFVHFGVYSQIKKGEWYKFSYSLEDEKYNSLIKGFNVKKSWAKELVKTAKKAGAKYITLTARHHDGFSLFDTCGLSTYDSIHLLGRDLIKEFSDECHKNNIIPFFYHTLIDWNEKTYDTDFDTYIDYLINSVELLCKNYGEVGGFWFDGFWAKPEANWQFERLYSTIRKYQPNAMIINNTGLSALGEVSHPEIDSVTFERGAPSPVNNSDGKPRAGEVCDSLTDHWGYAEKDICIKSIPYIIDLLVDCRKYNANLLLNVGPTSDGSLRLIEKATLLELGKWTKKYEHILTNCVPAEFDAENAVILKDDKYHYAIIRNVPMASNENVQRRLNRPQVVLNTHKKVKSIYYLDSKTTIKNIKNNTFEILPFDYGESMYARVVRFKVK